MVYQVVIDIQVNLLYHLDKVHLLYINYQKKFRRKIKIRITPYGRTASSAVILCRDLVDIAESLRDRFSSGKLESAACTDGTITVA